MFGGKKTGVEAVADVGFGKRKNYGRRLQGFGKKFSFKFVNFLTKNNRVCTWHNML